MSRTELSGSQYPSPSEYLPYFGRYISLVPDTADILRILTDQLPAFRASLGSLPDSRAGYRYAADKWSVREMVGHLVDTERVFGYRALWFARGDQQPLPSFEQDEFVATAQHDRCPIAELVSEFCALRESHVLMFRHFDTEAWTRTGTASGHAMSARAAAFILAGHVYHHSAILRERYGVAIALGVTS